MRSDQPHGCRIYIDIDIIYPDFKRSIIRDRIIEKLPQVDEYLEAHLEDAQMRPSSSGNAHLMLTYDRTLTVLEILATRAWLHDDNARLMLDLVRYLRTGDPAQTNRLWSGKYKIVDFEAEMLLCGEWEPLIPLCSSPQPG